VASNLDFAVPGRGHATWISGFGTRNQPKITTGKPQENGGLMGFNGIYIGWGPQDSVQLVYKWLKKPWFMVDITN